MDVLINNSHDLPFCVLLLKFQLNKVFLVLHGSPKIRFGISHFQNDNIADFYV